jgi:hypothetical protein
MVRFEVDDRDQKSLTYNKIITNSIINRFYNKILNLKKLHFFMIQMVQRRLILTLTMSSIILDVCV